MIANRSANDRAAALQRVLTGRRLRVASQLRWATRRFHVLPDFLIIGAQRCGTTSLYHYLAQHPNIELPAKKEIHFFDNNYHRGIAWYQTQFPFVTARTKTYIHRSKILTGEASPYYLFHPHAARRIFETIPNAKLIVLLRNPVDRAYSHYIHEIRGGFEQLSFVEAIQREPHRLAGENARMAEDISYYSFNHQHYSYLSRGVYVNQLRSVYSKFSQKHVLVLESEDLYSSPASVLARVQSFLGIEICLPASFEAHNVGNYSTMDSATRRGLVEFFRPHNQQLYEFLGVEFGWDK